MANIKTQFGAKGDGVTDDTLAIRSAIRAEIGYTSKPKVVYFPSGTYLVSDSLDWHNQAGAWDAFLTFQGETRDSTIIRLRDRAAGYANPAIPRAVVLTASAGGTADGGGNKGQNNFLLDLTVDTGVGNPGAVGIDYMANNRCAIRDVLIRSGDGVGVAGLSMTRYATGPCLVQDLEVDGFSAGVVASNLEYGLTFERLTVLHQGVVGLQVNDNVVSVHNLVSANSVPAINIASRYNRPIALVTLINGSLTGGASTVSGINNGGNLYARDVTAQGYQSVVSNVAGLNLAEYASSPLSGSAQSLNLPVQETPLFADYNPADWASVVTYGAKSNNGDATAGIQAAIDSGKPVVYFPLGTYTISAPLHLRGTTRALIGLESNLYGQGTAFASGALALVNVESAGDSTVFIRGLTLGAPGTTAGVVDASTATLVLQDIKFPPVAYHNTPDAGPLFIEDVDGGAWSFDHPQQIWARQLNSEPNAVKVSNNGATLWLFGFKTERPTTALVTTSGGATELLGGLLYPVYAVDPNTPGIVSVDSSTSAIYATSAYSTAANYAIQIQTTHRGVTHTWTAQDLPQRSRGSVTSLFTDPLNLLHPR